MTYTENWEYLKDKSHKAYIAWERTGLKNNRQKEEYIEAYNRFAYYCQFLLDELMKDNADVLKRLKEI